MRANTFGFYSLNGNNVVEFKENSKKESVCEFLERVRERNPDGKIVMILDNFRSHWANMTRERAEELNIELIFLPTYSPDLNPIEYIWKSIKRIISPIFFKCRETFLEVIENSFYKLADKMSFAIKWLKTFLPIKSEEICP